MFWLRKEKNIVFNYALSSGSLKCVKVRVKSGHFGHQVNSGIRLQTVKIQTRRHLMSRAHQNFHCLPSKFVFLFQNENVKQFCCCPNLHDVRSYLTSPFIMIHLVSL